MIGAGGLVGALAGLGVVLPTNMLPWLSLGLLIAGLVGYARLQLNAHQPKEVYVGFFTGFFCEYLAIIFSWG